MVLDIQIRSLLMHSTETETHTQREREGEEVYCFGKVSHFCSSSSSMMPRSIPYPHLSHIVARKQEDGSGRVSKHRGPSVRRIRERERMIETSLSVTKASHRRNDSRPRSTNQRALIAVRELGCWSHRRPLICHRLLYGCVVCCTCIECMQPVYILFLFLFLLSHSEYCIPLHVTHQ